MYTPWLSSEHVGEVNGDFSRQANVTLRQITDRINANLVERQCFLDRDPEDMSPWGLYFAYRICGMHMRMRAARKGTHGNAPHGMEVVKSLREAFSTINMRWQVAGVYLQLLEAQEAIHQGT